MALKKRTKKRVQKIIDEKFFTPWEFILNEIACEMEQDEWDDEAIKEVSDMITVETMKRHNELWQNNKKQL